MKAILAIVSWISYLTGIDFPNIIFIINYLKDMLFINKSKC